MKRLVFTLLPFLICLSATAGKYDGDSIVSNSININTEYYFGSNALTVDLASTFFRNGFIDNGIKDVISNNLSSSNIFGTEFRYELNYRRKVDTLFGFSNAFFQVGFRDVFHYGGRFSADVFELFFRGNKNYAGKKAVLSDFQFQQFLYQQLYVTFGHTYKSGENTFVHTIGLNFNKGQQFIFIEAPYATMYTSETGEYLDLDAEMEIHRNDSAKNNKMAFNGYGGSLDLSFKFTDKKKRDLEFSVQNLGMIAWNNKSSYVSADTAFKFEGVDISELFDFTDSVTNTVALDSSLTDPYLTNRTTKSLNTMLPCQVRLTYSIPLEKYHTTIETGLGYLLFANSKPMIWQNYQYKFNRSNSLGVSVRYGGYSGFGIGMNYELKVSGWKLQLRTDQLTGFIMKDATAQGAFVSLTRYF
ncbi:MAG TPA: DUF5723 family protein [Bacteroidia bacterium]|nr:DUF5723 family protein [Bacteroidia bacterium]